MRKTTILRAGTASLALSIALAAVPGFAQVTSGPTTAEADEADADGSDTAGSIVVTGSRIARPDLQSVSPVASVTAEQISLTGTQTIETLLNDLPQVAPGVNRTSNNPSGNFVTLDLRGLGPTRTLILVNGDRIPSSSTAGTVDVSQIPNSLIERIDVVTGGATAVYGSDAIAGVVNFILKDDFEGLELDAFTGISERGDGFQYSFGGLFGGNFDDGRGNITVSTSYYEREGVNNAAFDYSRTTTAVFYNPATDRFFVTDDPSTVPAGSTVASPGGSATPPWGQVQSNAANPFRGLAALLPGQFAAANTDCNAATPGVPVNGGALSFNDAGVLTPYFGGGLCAIPIRANGSSRYNFAPDNLLVLPFNRFNFVATGRYEFSDQTRARLYMGYTESHLTQQLAPTPAADGTGFNIDPTIVNANCVGAQIACALPTDLLAALNSRPNPAATFLFNRRFNETGPRVGEVDIFSIIGRASLEHDLSENWTVDTSLAWGRNRIDSYSVGNINRTAVEQGFYGCRNSAGTLRGPGILPGCVAVDIYGPNTLTPAMINFIQTDTVDFQKFEQIRLAANITGSLFELPGGPVGVAVGGEYRKDTGELVPDDAKQRGEIIGFNAAQPQAGQIIAKEVYGEIRLPILGGDGGFPDMLAVEAGARYSDYSTIGGLFNWKVGAEFAPISWIRFRGAYNRAARAPNVAELFQNGDQGFPAVTDPCNRPAGATETRSAATLARCARDGVPVATYLQPNSQVQAFAFGQADLSEEKAETYTAGVVITPDWFPIGRLSLTADYYNIELRGAIQALSAQFYLNACYTAAVESECARIVRDPGTGNINSVATGRRNNPDTLGPTKLEGLDFGVNWAFDLGPGRFRISDLFSYALTYETGGTDFIDTVGAGLGGLTPEFKNSLTVGYDLEGFSSQVRYTYASGGDASPTFCGTPSATNPGCVDRYRIPDYHSVQLSLRYSVSENFQFTATVDNLLDDLPPQTFPNEQNNTFPYFYSNNVLGRSYTFSGKVRF